MNHIDNRGKPCHGQEVVDFVGTRAYHAPHISKELCQWVERCLLLGMSAECVHQKHRELVHDKVSSFEIEFDRNDFLSRDDIGNIERKLKHAQYMFDKNDAQSVRIWQAANPDKVFYYSEFDKTVDDESHTPFIVGIQLPLQLEWMRKYGHDSILAMDSTFGTNRFKVCLYIMYVLFLLSFVIYNMIQSCSDVIFICVQFQLYTLLAFDSQHNGVPVAWVIMSRSMTSDISKWMETLLLKVRMGMLEWKLNAFMVDDAAAEIGAIRYI